MKAIIIQARTGSTRLPGKVLADFYDGQSILEIIINRCKELDAEWPVIVATSAADADKAIVNLATACGVKTFAGDEQDVLKRFIDAAEQFGARKLIRVCADNPFLDKVYCTNCWLSRTNRKLSMPRMKLHRDCRRLKVIGEYLQNT